MSKVQLLGGWRLCCRATRAIPAVARMCTTLNVRTPCCTCPAMPLWCRAGRAEHLFPGPEPCVSVRLRCCCALHREVRPAALTNSLKICERQRRARILRDNSLQARGWQGAGEHSIVGLTRCTTGLPDPGVCARCPYGPCVQKHAHPQEAVQPNLW